MAGILRAAVAWKDSGLCSSLGTLRNDGLPRMVPEILPEFVPPDFQGIQGCVGPLTGETPLPACSAIGRLRFTAVARL